jgi:hypothetical protein
LISIKILPNASPEPLSIGGFKPINSGKIMRKITLRITEEDYELAFLRSQASTQSINAFFVGLLHQSDGTDLKDDGINTKSDGTFMKDDGINLEARLAQIEHRLTQVEAASTPISEVPKKAILSDCERFEQRFESHSVNLPWRIPGQGSLNNLVPEYVEYIQRVYLPTTPAYKDQFVSLATAKKYIRSREKDPDEVIALHDLYADWEAHAALKLINKQRLTVDCPPAPGAAEIAPESAEMAVARLKAKMSLGGNLQRSAEDEIEEKQLEALISKGWSKYR